MSYEGTPPLEGGKKQHVDMHPHAMELVVVPGLWILFEITKHFANYFQKMQNRVKVRKSTPRHVLIRSISTYAGRVLLPYFKIKLKSRIYTTLWKLS